MSFALWLMSLIIHYYICGKLNEAGISRTIKKIYIIWCEFWFIMYRVSHFFYWYPDYDLMPDLWAETLYALSYTWLIMSLLLFMGFLGVSILTRFKPFTITKIYLAVIIALFWTSYGILEAYYVQRREITITTHKLPEGTGRIRIAYISDMHMGGLYTRYHFDRAMKIIDEAEPDIFILCGDIISGNMDYRKYELSRLSTAAHKARYGAFAVNGNHEHYHFLDWDVEGIIRSCGFTLLNHERTETAGITIIGFDDILRGWLRIHLKPEDSERFVLVIKHRPGIPVDADGKFDLQISGHTHAGQFWPLGYFKNMAQNSTQGLSHKSGGYVYVSNGTGFGVVPMRIFARPEVTIIDIVRE